MKEREGERERDSKRDVSSDPTSNTNLHFYSGRELDILVDIYANNVTGNILAKEHDNLETSLYEQISSQIHSMPLFTFCVRVTDH